MGEAATEEGVGVSQLHSEGNRAADVAGEAGEAASLNSRCRREQLCWVTR